MKKFLLIFSLLAFTMLFHACKQQQSDKKEISTDLIQNPVNADGISSKSKLPVIEFDESNHDFNIILEGEVVSYTFRFTNKGGADLIVSEVSTSCGCTTPHFSRKPIAPGERGEIEVLFNSENRHGSQHKSITVLANTQPNRTELSIDANVVSPNQY